MSYCISLLYSREKVGGICGDYDGNGANDLTTKEGEDVSTSSTMGSDIGNSWYEDDHEDPA